MTSPEKRIVNKPRARFTRTSAIRKFVRERDRQVSVEFLNLLDDHIGTILTRATLQFNGHKKRLDSSNFAMSIGGR